MDAIIALLLGSHLIMVVVVALLMRQANYDAARFHRERIEHARTRAKLLFLSPPLDPAP